MRAVVECSPAMVMRHQEMPVAGVFSRVSQVAPIACQPPSRTGVTSRKPFMQIGACCRAATPVGMNRRVIAPEVCRWQGVCAVIRAFSGRVLKEIVRWLSQYNVRMSGVQ